MYIKLGRFYINLNEVLWIEKAGSGADVHYKNGETLKVRLVIHENEFEEIVKK
jgi:hypothetical protein